MGVVRKLISKNLINVFSFFGHALLLQFISPLVLQERSTGVTSCCDTSSPEEATANDALLKIKRFRNSSMRNIPADGGEAATARVDRAGGFGGLTWQRTAVAGRSTRSRRKIPSAVKMLFLVLSETEIIFSIDAEETEIGGGDEDEDEPIVLSLTCVQ